MGEIIELAEIKAIKEQIQSLKEDLADYVFERDELKYVVCENIKTSYLLEFGGLEYQIYQAYCQYHRLQRKKELIQAKKNRQENINLKEIEGVLDQEFIEYQQRLDEMVTEINQALDRSKFEPLGPEEKALLKKIYRRIVKELHPDLNSSQSENDKRLFNHATQAYKSGDLTRLQIIEQIIGGESAGDITSHSLTSLEQEKDQLQNLIEQLQDEIEAIKSEIPYIWRFILEDDQKKADKFKELKQNLESFQAAIQTQEEYIKDLMGDQI